MSIAEAILFVTSTSRASVPCLQFIAQYKLPVIPVRLDTPEAREKAANGKYFQITVVPTLVITYVDGNIQLFVGTEKIIQWMKSALSRPQVPQRVIESDSDNEDETPVPMPVRSKPKKKVKFEEEAPEEPEDEMVEEEKPGKSKKKKSKSKTGSAGLYDVAKKKPKKKPVTFDDDTDEPSEDTEVTIELIGDTGKSKKGGKRTKQIPIKGLMVGPDHAPSSKASMANLIKQAQQMEKDRQATLGYDEKDLPYND